MNIPPLAAHFFVFWFGCLSGLTPPVALASYTAAGMAGSNPKKVAMTGLRLAAPGFLFPFLLMYRPELLGLSAPVFRLVTHGYFMGKLSLWEKALMGIGSVMLVNPDMWSYVGVTMIACVLVYRWYRARTERNRPAGPQCEACA